MSGREGRPVSGGPDHCTPTGRSGHATDATRCERAVGTPAGDRFLQGGGECGAFYPTQDDLDGGGGGKFNGGLMQQAQGALPGELVRAVGTPADEVEEPMEGPFSPSENQISEQKNAISSRDTAVEDFILLQKNCRGLTNDDRIDELRLELTTTQWDIAVLNETWRREKKEYWKTEDGHLFAGSGAEVGRRGVAFLVHSRWVSFVTSFAAVDERIAYIDFKKGCIKFRVVACYFPHCGYNDGHVQRMYTTMSQIHAECAGSKKGVMIAGGFNAVVGRRVDTDDKRTLGPFGIGDMNPRGDWLKQWATLENLVISNTYYDKPPAKRTTYIGPNGEERQIDFILIDRLTWKKVKDSGSTNDLDLGSDHKATRLRLRWKREGAPNTSSSKKQRVRRHYDWQQVDKELFSRGVQQKLEDLQLSERLHDRCQQIEGALNEAATNSQARPPAAAQSMPNKAAINELINQRRSLPSHARQERSAISKMIHKSIKRCAREEHDVRIGNIIENRSGLKRIRGIQQRGKRHLISHMRNAAGERVYHRTSIANVFADFYEQLYTTTRHTGIVETTLLGESDSPNIPPFQMEELITETKKLKKGRCKDGSGLIAEMIKSGGSVLASTLLDLYNEVIKPDASIPETWKRSTISVIFKSGAVDLPLNYRPITIIPLLYKLFARLLYSRLAPFLDKAQPPDQAGFRPGYSAVDHLFTFGLLDEKCHELNINLWTAALDFKKAFDTVEHDAMSKALTLQGVPKAYVTLLCEMYCEQTAQVRTDQLSKTFRIQRGTKQGDPLSSLLFNAVLEDIFRVS